VHATFKLEEPITIKNSESKMVSLHSNCAYFISDTVLRLKIHQLILSSKENYNLSTIIMTLLETRKIKNRNVK
jgi:hypothetical protein